MPVRLVGQISAQEKRETQIAQGERLITTWYIIIRKAAIPLCLTAQIMGLNTFKVGGFSSMGNVFIEDDNREPILSEEVAGLSVLWASNTQHWFCLH